MSDFDREVAELLEQAMKQPGVAEVAEVFESQRAVIATFERAEAALAPRFVHSVGTSTGADK